ncbi:MAG TPA: HAMP domain-containing sensor histidine kinase [Candidatus Dormibacteraeota bacterium]
MRSLTARLVVGALAVIAISLVVSGVLTGVLVRRLENDQTVQRLERAVVNARRAARVQGLEALGSDPGGNRLLLVDASGALIYDSEGTASSATTFHFGATRIVGGVAVRDGTVTIGGNQYEAAALLYRRGQYLVAARASDAVSVGAISALVPRLLVAGLVALGVAVVLAVALARTIADPLRELGGAAEDIAAGNYARRVRVRGPAEVGIVAVAFNRMAEAVERSRSLQRDFLANVSHELKTPLTSLIGFSQALVDGSLRTAAERKRAAAILHEESQRLLRMSQELLDLARVEAGQVSFTRGEVDLAELLRQQAELVRPRAAARGLDLQLEVLDGMPPALADVERVHQVLDNLLDNAVKYAPPGTEVRVTARGAGPQVEASIWNAVAEQPVDVGRMFDRFYRADASRPAAGGVGLGLAISRELAQAMGGTLTADQRDGGVALSLRLPAAQQGTS